MPFRKLASSESMNATTAATSFERPVRPSGVTSMSLCIDVGSAASCRPCGVSMIPGASEHTRAPTGPSRTASLRANRATPCLAHG